MKLKYQKVLIIPILIVALFTTGCGVDSMLNSRLLTGHSLDAKATTELESIVSAIESGDKGAIKSMFSEDALEEAEDIDAQIDELFEFYQGTMEEHDNGSNDTSEGVGFNGSEDIISEVIGYYEVKTTEDVYLIDFDYWVKCMTKSKEGLRNISIIQKSYYKQDENHKKFGTRKAGVFVVAPEQE